MIPAGLASYLVTLMSPMTQEMYLVGSNTSNMGTR